jgi:6-phosphogluconolactonase
MSKKEILVFEHTDQLEEYAIEKWGDIAEDALKQRDIFTVALSGGSTPVKLYENLSGTDLKWDRTHIFIVDERFVPFDHKDSNFRMIYETLLGKIAIPEHNIHAVLTEQNSPDESASSYEREMVSFFKISSGSIPVFDLILLGVGNDGHTASLFPGSSALVEDDRLAVSAVPSNTSMHERITITFPVINSARNVIVQITGSTKAEVVKDILENENSALPAASVRPYDGNLIFLLDRQAGALLSGD